MKIRKKDVLQQQKMGKYAKINVFSRMEIFVISIIKKNLKRLFHIDKTMNFLCNTLCFYL